MRMVFTTNLNGSGEQRNTSHDYEGNFTPQAYLPEGRHYYEPTENGLEKRIKERLEYWRSRLSTPPEKDDS